MSVERARTEVIGPEAVIELGTAFCTAKILLAAVELRVFTVLDDGDATADELCARVPLHPRGARDFLEALVILGLLERQGGRYRNALAADRYLVRGRPGHLGGFLQRADAMLYPAWGRLAEALRSGRPQAVADFAEMSRDSRRLSGFLDMMDDLTGALAPELAHGFDWSSQGSVADIGGARGNLAAQLVKAHPHLRAVVFDLPQMRPFFDRHMAALGVTGRVRFLAGDFFADALPRAEVLIIGHVLHDWTPKERRALVAKAFDALPPGGSLLVYDRMLDEEPTDVANLVISLSMLLTTPGGAEYPVAECRAGLEDVGFVAVSHRRLGARDTLVVGRKDG